MIEYSIADLHQKMTRTNDEEEEAAAVADGEKKSARTGLALWGKMKAKAKVLGMFKKGGPK